MARLESLKVLRFTGGDRHYYFTLFYAAINLTCAVKCYRGYYCVIFNRYACV